MTSPLSCFAATCPGLMLFETTEFFGAFFAVMAMAVVPPATAMIRASVATTLA
jgi:hypothetical protein